jgi:hypothetical protein
MLFLRNDSKLKLRTKKIPEGKTFRDLREIISDKN